MCFKNRNSQTDSKVKTCKECIDKKTLNIVSCWIRLFYVFLAAISVSAVLIFYKTNTFIGRLFIFLLMLAAYITIICFYSCVEKVKCKEIYDDLNVNCIYMACSTAYSFACLFISACVSSNYVTKINVSLAFMLVTCIIGFRAKFYNNKYALAKIDIDYMSTTNKYSKIGEHERESELLVIKKSFLRYYKTMETNYLMMSALFTFITSVLGVSSISSLKSASTLFVLNIAM